MANRTRVETEKGKGLSFLTPTTTIASPRQGTRLIRPDPRPQIESTLYWDPD